MKNAYDGLISSLNTAEKRISKLSDMTTELPIQKGKEEKKRLEKNQKRIFKNCGATT